MVKITIYRGSHQIGGCATEIRTNNHRVIIDFGADLPDSKAEGTVSDEVLAQTVFNGEPCDGVLFSHYHGDHIGLYQKIPQDIPLYIGSTAKKLLEILTEKLDSSPKAAEKGLPRVQSIKCYAPGQKLDAWCRHT